MIRDPAVGVNAHVLPPSLPELDTRLSVARAARMDAVGASDGPAVLPTRDLDRSAGLDAAAHAAGLDVPEAPAVPLIPCRCTVQRDSRHWGHDVTVTSPWSGDTLTLPDAYAEQAVPGIVARVRLATGMADFTRAELAALAAAHRKLRESTCRVLRRFNAKLAHRDAHPRGRGGRFATRFS